MKQIILVLGFCIFSLAGKAQDELHWSERDAIEWGILEIKKVLVQKDGPTNIDTLISFFANPHEFLGVNIQGRGWFYKEYIDELRNVYAGSTQKIRTTALETRILSRDLVLIVWLGENTVTLRDGRVLELKGMTRTLTLRNIGGKWKIIYFHESVGAPVGTFPPHPPLPPVDGN